MNDDGLRLCPGGGHPPDGQGARLGRQPPGSICPVCSASLPILTFQGTIPAHRAAEGYVPPEPTTGEAPPSRAEIVRALTLVREAASVLDATSRAPAAVQVLTNGRQIPVIPCQVQGLQQLALGMAEASQVLDRAFPRARTRDTPNIVWTGVVVPLFGEPPPDDLDSDPDDDTST